ncbi:hypothetical protein BGW36DRAFT_392144 [Talaromyces proteolyticus]|uniref:Siderophore biosynthesis enzyme n=1 Tax=Talaromyces proteolyticus TaxID=1131652 RepID=A0AAD4PSF3_9EURO|nr:uncharacterized protein BGW36DRAFT_392144 [Talaromyces proteolyticus]KAH8688770.1 hypothetical protein BGW36DRAFT_392144 [Talaromyces proteolyticus]
MHTNFKTVAVAVATLTLTTTVLARTDLVGCTSSIAGPSLVWYVPGTGELCDFLDCGGGRAPPKYSVPGCPLYTGTATYSPSYLPGYGPNAVPVTAAAASSESSIFLSGTTVAGQSTAVASISISTSASVTAAATTATSATGMETITGLPTVTTPAPALSSSVGPASSQSAVSASSAVTPQSSHPVSTGAAVAVKVLNRAVGVGAVVAGLGAAVL